MSVITNRGKDAKESANKKKIDFKKVYIRLKDGDSVRVRVPSVDEYVEYIAHGDYNLGINTQPCIAPTGARCAYDEVADYIRDMKIDKDDEAHPFHKYRGLYGKSRYLFAFYDIDTKMVRLFDASKEQAKSIIADIEKYAKHVGKLAFTFSRTGEKNATKYSLSPIMADDMEPKDTEAFNSYPGFDGELYEEALMPRTFDQQVEELKRVGFPVDDLFGKDAAAGKGSAAGDEEVTPIPDEEALPF